MTRRIPSLALPALLAVLAPAHAQGPAGYYRFPALHGSTVVFTAEGDLWTVDLAGGEARRLTSHPGQETRASISPDGREVAFSADYEGPTEVYVMPLAGGLPRRLTWHGEPALVAGWTPAGEVVYATRHFATLPDHQLSAVHPRTLARRRLPLAQASEAAFDPGGDTLVFTRPSSQSSFTKRYRGGTAQKLWRFSDGDAEAAPLTADFAGTSRWPSWWQGRIYFASDRDNTLNLWSMAPDGSGLTQHTRHRGWDVKSPSVSQGRVVYQLGADLRTLDLATGEDRLIPITLPSDFDQQRERWLDEPMDYLTASHLSPRGDRVVLTARGQVFVAPVEAGRLVEASRRPGVRYRSARFLPDGKSLSVLSDESGEVELWTLDARGVAAPRQLTEGGNVLRFDALPSPDGARLAFTDKNQELWVLEVASRRATRVDRSEIGDLPEFTWSPDGRWLAYVLPAENFLHQIKLYEVATGTKVDATSDRFDSFSPAFSPDGKYLYFLSNRTLTSLRRGPWGNYQPGPFLDRVTRIYLLALREGLESPFAPPNELSPAQEVAGKEDGERDAAKGGPEEDGAGEGAEPGLPAPAVRVEIDARGLAERLFVVPVPAGTLSTLATNGEQLFYLSATTAAPPEVSLLALPVKREKAQPKTLLAGLTGYELSADGKKLLLSKEQQLFVRPASAEPIADLSEHRVDLAGWKILLDPKEEWRQMLTESWRLLRDYFYDPGMHGVDWRAVLDKYRPLVERVTDRAELSDLFGEMTGELSALHHYVNGGDLRTGDDPIEPASLGAVLERDPAAGGLRVKTIYAADPDLPEELSPLARPGVGVREGDLLTAINGTPALAAPDAGALLRNQAGKQVLLTVVPAGTGEPREVIVEPLDPRGAAELRYDAWELERRRAVERLGGGEIGYVHLRAMGGGNYTEWARHFFPVFQRPGLIIDLRHNRGGNIDSWILGQLVRKAWMWWQPRVGQPYSNMQFAFSGHAVVLIDEWTSSDGEAFAEGFRRLGLGKVIGTRSWGGEIWLTSSNTLVDNGIATAAEFGVYGPEGRWLIEGHGVDPDLTVDNLPRATFDGRDAQLEAAVAHLEELIREQPPQAPPPAPPYPDKSFEPPP